MNIAIAIPVAYILWIICVLIVIKFGEREKLELVVMYGLVFFLYIAIAVIWIHCL